jgi:hypothetical protein
MAKKRRGDFSYEGDTIDDFNTVGKRGHRKGDQIPNDIEGSSTEKRIIHFTVSPLMQETLYARAAEKGFRSAHDYLRWLIIADCRNNLLYLDEAIHTIAVWIGDTIGGAAGKVIFDAEQAFIAADITKKEAEAIQAARTLPREIEIPEQIEGRYIGPYERQIIREKIMKMAKKEGGESSDR